MKIHKVIISTDTNLAPYVASCLQLNFLTCLSMINI